MTKIKTKYSRGINNVLLYDGRTADQEYYLYSSFYDKIFANQDFSQEYKSIITTTFLKMPTPLKRLYNQYAPYINIKIDNKRKCSSYFLNLNEIHLAVNKDLEEGKGRSFYHEVAHLIDLLADNLTHNDELLSPNFYSREFNLYKNIIEDYKNALTTLVNQQDKHYKKAVDIAKADLAIDIMKHYSVSSTVSDLFYAVSNNLNVPYSHSKEYWTLEGYPQSLSAEAFAEITTAYALRDYDKINYTKKWLPVTVDAYKKLIALMTESCHKN